MSVALSRVSTSCQPHLDDNTPSNEGWRENQVISTCDSTAGTTALMARSPCGASGPKPDDEEEMEKALLIIAVLVAVASGLALPEPGHKARPAHTSQFATVELR